MSRRRGWVGEAVWTVAVFVVAYLLALAAIVTGHADWLGPLMPG